METDLPGRIAADVRRRLEAECEAIWQDCVYTAETHHIIARKCKKLGYIFQIAPAIIAALIGVAGGIADDSGAVGQWLKSSGPWLAAIAAGIAAVSNLLNPFGDYQEHLRAGKGFTVLKHDARALRFTFSSTMSSETFMASVRTLHDRYSDLVRSTPETDPNSFEEARQRVKDQKLHDLDPMDERRQHPAG